MDTVSHEKTRRVLLATTAGLAAAVFARVAIFIATSPHSVLMLTGHLWQLPASCAIGVVAFVLCYRAVRRPTLPVSIISLLALSFGVALHGFVFEIPLAQQFLPGIWVK